MSIENQHSISIGTSGYSYPDWVGTIYPPQAKPRSFIEHYQKIFNFVELNSSYYRIPRESSIRSLAEKTPLNFQFSVKAHSSFTHTHELCADSDFQISLNAFCTALTPFVERNQLVGVVAQFPWSFHYTTRSRKFLFQAIKMFQESTQRQYACTVPLFIEFRNAEWMRDSAIKGLQELSCSWLMQDGPSLKGLPGTIEASADLLIAHGLTRTDLPIYLRFHGRNGETWWTGNNISRYDYLYSEQELREIASVIDRLKHAGASTIIIAFNNHHRGQAVQNARDLKLIID